jgi:hypothetical protein
MYLLIDLGAPSSHGPTGMLATYTDYMHGLSYVICNTPCSVTTRNQNTSICTDFSRVNSKKRGKFMDFAVAKHTWN